MLKRGGVRIKNNIEDGWERWCSRDQVVDVQRQKGKGSNQFGNRRLKKMSTDTVSNYAYYLV